MGTSRLDSFVPDYASNVAVTVGQVWQGPLIPLYGVTGMLAHCRTLNGAAGSLLIYFTNFDGVIGLTDPLGYPAQTGAVTVTVPANSIAGTGILPTNVQIYANKCWLAFNPTASGNIYIGVNMRRAMA